MVVVGVIAGLTVAARLLHYGGGDDGGGDGDDGDRHLLDALTCSFRWMVDSSAVSIASTRVDIDVRGKPRNSFCWRWSLTATRPLI